MNTNTARPERTLARRFVALEDVQATLSISRSQAYALVRSRH